MSKSPYITFITTTNSLYDRYEADWKLCINSYYGGVEYKNGRYLRAYLGDLAVILLMQMEVLFQK